MALAMQPAFARQPARLELGPTPIAIYWRRRAVALLVFAGLVLALATTAARLGREPHVASEPTSQRVQLVATHIHVVAPGDTLWTIARAAQPTGDVRPLVHQLAGLRRGAPLQVGERVSVPVVEKVTVGRQ
ncbi:MAG: LysM peptidoglycan-binding domain-containing protein [Actinobacteria bacterium]|nr:LysM peptidoglycan-binding domain-containing protein [Actinomycetota bacterium]